MEILIITGPPYSGKGTQCEILKNVLGFKHISTGNRCRLEKQKGSECGIVLSGYEEHGELVPDVIMKDLLNLILKENKNENGIILDGYPRTIAQVDYLLELVLQKQITIRKVCQIEVDRQELLNRAVRRSCKSGRIDDKDPTIHKKRIEVFKTSTKPSIEYMKTKLDVFTCYSKGTKEELTQQILVELF